MSADRHWLEVIDHASNNPAIREELAEMVKRETTKAYDAGVSETEARLVLIDDQTRDERLVDIYLAGFVSGAVHLGAQVGVAPAAAYADSSHTAWHIKEDPIARAQLAEAVLVKWLTGERPPPATITAYGLPSDPEETT